MRNTTIVIMAYLLLAPLAAKADFELEQYQRYSQDPAVKEHMDDCITGLGRGIFWANVMLALQKKGRLFCMPEKLALDGDVIRSLLDQEIRSPSDAGTYKADTPIELILVNAFVHRFPCDE